MKTMPIWRAVNGSLVKGAPRKHGNQDQSLDKQFSRYAKVFGQQLNLGLTDTALTVHKVGHLRTRTEHRNQVCLRQPAVFHEKLRHLVWRDIGQGIVSVVIVLNKLDRKSVV